MIRQLLFFGLLISFHLGMAQQNLVLNPSFEDNFLPIQCNSNMGETFPLTHWTYGSLGTTDAISMTVPLTCNNHPLHPSLNNQLPRTGNNYVGLFNVYSQGYKWREYLRGKLSQSLQVGARYHIEFYVCLGAVPSTNAGTNNIGLKFINDLDPIYPTSLTVNEVPDVNYTGAPIVDRDNWQLLSFEFIANSPNMDAFVIGNFFSDEETVIQILYPGTWYPSYLLLEDVSIYEMTPIFNITDEICFGDPLILPNTSLNGIVGTWSPAVNNQQTTTYTFTPNNPAFDQIQKTVVVKPKVTPVFTQLGPFCDEVPNITALPTISNNGIEGTWSPVFNPNQTTTYTFTPNEGFCSEVVIMQVIVDRTPIFNPIDPFCNYDLNFTLPLISKNGISGTWSPEFDPYNSQTYTFTRDSGYCTQQVSLNVVVHKEFYFDLFSYCEDDSYFVEVRFLNDFIPNVKKIEWKINQTVISQFGLKVKLSDFSDLLQDENIISLSITDENDCVRSHEIKIIGKNYCKIQNGISPNGDGLNEYFDLASFGGVHLIISNRYGKEVYENKNYKVEWRGQSNKGNMLPSGTYFYQIKTNIGEHFTGWIQLTL